MSEQDETTPTEEGALRGRVLDLSTTVDPPPIVAIDDEEFELRTMEHLSPLDEAKLRALVAKEERFTDQLTKVPTTDNNRLEAIAMQLRKTRIDLILLMTTIPKEKIEALPVPAQQQLIALIGGVV
jgi:hypothetical protein